MELTQKQERFCQVYIELGNASEAYRQVYNADKMRPETINRTAKDLLDNTKITARLNELRAPAVEAAQLTLESHLAKLAELRDEARQRGQLSAAISAEGLRGKAAGLYVTRQEITGKGGRPIEVKEEKEYDLSEMTEDELRLCEWLVMRIHLVTPENEADYRRVHEEAQALVNFELSKPSQHRNVQL